MGHMLNVERDVETLTTIGKGEISVTKSEQERLLKSLRNINLLTSDFANTKMSKNSKKFSGYVSYILHLSPADLAFKAIARRGTLCPMASQGCKSACLNTAGRGRFDSIQLSRLRKTLYFMLFKNEFMSQLTKEIGKLQAKAYKNKKQLVLRLNGTSDVQWENIKINFVSPTGNKILNSCFNIFETFPGVQFYDYTKILKRIRNTYKNYYLTFSASESNDADWLVALANKVNVAMVFDSIPTSWQGFDVISGDEHDFRFLDARRGVIVGLKAKGKAKQDKSGFVK